MNLIDAINYARAWAVEFDRLIYVHGVYRPGVMTYEQCWQPDLTNLPQCHDRPVYRVWPNGTVELMAWTLQEFTQ